MAYDIITLPLCQIAWDVINLQLYGLFDLPRLDSDGLGVVKYSNILAIFFIRERLCAALAGFARAIAILCQLATFTAGSRRRRTR